MPRFRKPSKNPTIPALDGIETLSRDYLVNNRRTLRTVEPILREDTPTRRELDRVGGLNRILTQSGDQVLERTALPRFINLQTSLFVDRLTQGDINSTPALQPMFESSRNNTRILTAIGSSLDDCCEAIQEKLNDLEKLINLQFRRLRNYLIKAFDDLNQSLDHIKQAILDDAALNGKVLFDQINKRADTNQELINETNTFIQNKVNERSDGLEGLVKESFDNLKFILDNKFQNLYDKLTNSFSTLTRYIESSFSALEFNIKSMLATQSLELEAAFELYYTTTVSPILGGLATGIGELATVTGIIEKGVLDIKKELTTLLQPLEDVLNKRLDEFKEYLENWKKDLIEDIAEEVSLQVVGESYFKWDSTCTYFPTITFLFKESNTEQYPRRSQIKVRYSKRNEEITEKDIRDLKEKCLLILNQEYSYGIERYNYISSDKRFKTTVFGANAEEIKLLFTNLFSVFGESFNEKNLSITSGRNRTNVTKRTKPLIDVDVNKNTYQTTFPLKFKKAVLLVNGLEKPITLAKN